MTFFDIAKPLAERGIPQVRTRPGTKIAFETDWPTRATTDLETLKQWSDEMPDANAASVARAEENGFWFFELDRDGLYKQIEKETGQKFPKTFVVRSSQGRGHLYFRHNSQSLAMGNCQAKDEKGELWSARADSRYVISAGSLHPTSGKKYEVLSDAEIIPAPEWLINWCTSKKVEDKKVTASADGARIPYGSHDTTLTSIGGKLRQDGLEEEAIYNALVEVCEKRCENYGSDYKEMCRKISRSVSRYEITENPITYVNGLTVSTQPILVPQEEKPEIKPIPYPIFPEWVMKGTSVYKGLVEPVCRKNSRYPEYMFMPAVVVMLNYLGVKVRVKDKGLIPSIFLISIGRKGRVIKSSSATDAIEYFKTAGIVGHASTSTKNADSKSLIFMPGSGEGLGLEMARTNCKNAILFYDELSTLTKKASIESSSLATNLLTIYESDFFSNAVKSRREQYTLEPRSYCVSLIACTTDKNFQQHWSTMAGDSSGLDERFFFLYQPEILKDVTPKRYVDTVLGAVETKKLIDKAVKKGEYSITDETQLDEAIKDMDNRTEIRAEKFALYFAVDLDKDEIDEDCLERGIALAKYEKAVKKYLKTFESVTREGTLQNEIIRFLQCHNGVTTRRELERSLHPLKYGTSMWDKVYKGLINSRYLEETGDGTKGSPLQVVLIRQPEED